jgi:hypothetical protein
MVADEAHPAFGVKVFPVKAHDPSRFLPAMLKSMQAQRRQRCCVGMIEDAENPTFLVKSVILKPLEWRRLIELVCHGHGPFPINK